MSDLFLLKTALDKLRAEEYALNEEREAKRSEQLRVFTQQQTESLNAEFGDKMKALALQRSNADSAYKQALEERALAGTGAAYPLGTVLEEWGFVGSTWSRNRPFLKTDRRGVYTAVTRNTEFPENQRGRPDVGEFVVFLLKKDGSPSRRFLKSYEADRFHPDGWTPGTESAE